MTELTLAISAADHTKLHAHLFPGDGLEAAAILICGRAGRLGQRLCVSSVIPIPYEACCERTPVRLEWPGDYLDDAIEAADEIAGTIMLTHSHPGGFFGFSGLDDDSDQIVIPSLTYGSADETIPHGSAIMVPDGTMKVRLYENASNCREVSRVWRLGPTMEEISRRSALSGLPFSSSMTTALSSMTACVVGASGTGSPTIEMLARMGFARIVIVEFDKVEQRNLNRILNSTFADAMSGTLKVDVMERGARAHRPEIKIVRIAAPISDESAIIAASEADVLFCCVDTMEGRLYCDLISEACLIPFIDMGVMIPTRKGLDKIEVADVIARIDYVYPGGATLRDRGEITGEGLREEDMLLTDPEAYARNLQEGYIRGMAEEAPSVIALNMHASSLAVMDFIARLFPYRHDSNEVHDRIFLSLAACETEYELSTPPPSRSPRSIYGHGLKHPLLGMIANVSNRKDAV